MIYYRLSIGDYMPYIKYIHYDRNMYKKVNAVFVDFRSCYDCWMEMFLQDQHRMLMWEHVLNHIIYSAAAV